MISQTVEYALRALVHLAVVRREQSSQPSQTVEQIAAGTRVPEGYLAKVLQILTRAGLLTSQRGNGGGFRLAKAPEEVTVYEVVQVVDPLPRIRECPLGLEWHGAKLCPLHKALDEAVALVEAGFRATTISSLIEGTDLPGDPPSGKDACGFPIRLGVGR